MENVVQDLQKLLLVHPLLVLATKNSISGDKSTADELMRLLLGSQMSPFLVTFDSTDLAYRQQHNIVALIQSKF